MLQHKNFSHQKKLKIINNNSIKDESGKEQKPSSFLWKKFLLHTTTGRRILIGTASLLIAFLVLMLFLNHVPDSAKNSFAEKFPGATHVTWGMEGMKDYEAGFQLDGKNMSAVFMRDGTIEKTETVIEYTEVPAKILQQFVIDFPKSIIAVAEIVETPGKEMMYEIELRHNGETEEALYSSSGKLVEKADD